MKEISLSRLPWAFKLSGAKRTDTEWNKTWIGNCWKNRRGEKRKKILKKEEKEKKETEFFENYYESALSLEEIDPKKGIGKDEKIVLKYVRAYNEQVGLNIKEDTLIEGLKKEFWNNKKKSIKALKKAIKTGYLKKTTKQETIYTQ